ncbi:MAG: NADH:ubiquinone reductase (Na(+)-transporting) subunit B [Myxococcaceae bacterium]|jgi:Na+-transporting NADH:ubiquinone oxidoreductase subunit B|nr:NADH:ubiquinone reductase (Na(+)-transporting) subunit B [Myxococcaceae bacterium]
MKALRRALDKVAPHFHEKGRLAKLFPLYDAADTFLYTPASTTSGSTHVRDGLDLKRMMMTVVIALVPAIAMALYNTGYQALRLVEQGGRMLATWQTDVFGWTGLAASSSDVVSCVVLGALYFVPVMLVSYTAGGVFEVLFAVVRKHEVNEGFLVTGMLIPLTMPPTVPLWQVALGTAFGVVIGKEIFGGTGMNFLNPALVARAFLFFAYPAQLSGEVWVAAVPPDGRSGATWLASLAEGAGHLPGLTWWDAFVGRIPGSMGETSALACLLGAALLLVTRIGAWQTMLGVVVGTAACAMGLNAIGSSTNPMMALPFHWHAVLGGWAFGLVFMATDPVSSAFTSAGKLVYGFGIGVLCVLIRVVNPAYPEGMMLAILFMNMFAPLIDHAVLEANKRRRAARYARSAS